MPNAAHELADALQDWILIRKGQNVRISRSFQGDTTEDWREQVRVIGLLHEVDRYLSAATLSGREMGHYLRAYPKWAKGLIAPDQNWQESISGSARPVIDQPSIDLLRALGDIMASTELSVAMTPEASKGGTDAIDALLEALSDPSVHLRDTERRYVYELVSSVRRVFEESTVLGSVDLIARVHELLGVMTMLAETLAADPSTEGVAKKILRAVRRVVPYAAFGAKVSAGTIGVAADMLQITAG